MSPVKKSPAVWGDPLVYFDEETFITAENAVNRDELKAPPGQLAAPTEVIIKIISIHPGKKKGEGYVHMSVKLETLVKTPKMFGFNHPMETIIKEDTFSGDIYVGDDTTVKGLLQKIDISAD